MNTSPPSPTTTKDRLLNKLRTELGPVIMEALHTPNVTEVMLNPDGQVWIEQAGELLPTGSGIDTLRARMILNTIATTVDKVINAENPILECELDLDADAPSSRVLGVIDPVVASPTLVIRKHNPIIITLKEWIDTGCITHDEARLIARSVHEHKNIVICGGTGSGKTTLANTILQLMGEDEPNQRVIIIEDTRELQHPVKNTVAMRTKVDVNVEITIDTLLRTALRARPDRIIIGEVRGKEAWGLLKAWITGHPGGVCTIHATSASQARLRLSHMCSEANVPEPIVRDTVKEAVDVAIHIERGDGGKRRIKEIQKWE